jgi:mannose-6-phosphate isomerase
MTDRVNHLREAIRRPLPLAYHPLYRFYEGGSLTRQFRGLPDRPDDWWSEDWVGSCTAANNCDPDGREQGLSSVDLPGIGNVPLKDIVAALPEEMVGAAFAHRWGPITGVLVKLLSPAGPVPVHAHPSREWARQHLGSPFGKTEAWILLEAPGDGAEPAHAGIGFVGGVDRDWFADAVRARDSKGIRRSLHRTDVHPGEVYVAHAGVPHYLGPRISFIEIQEPSDHIVIPETSGDDDAGATMGLGWDLADVLPFFDATALEVADEIDTDDGRFSIAIVVSGVGSIDGDFGSQPVSRGETYALPACVPFRVRAARDPLRIIRCLGPTTEL